MTNVLKYELTAESIRVAYTTVYRIRALRHGPWGPPGTLGGFIESERNLVKAGNAWVGEHAIVSGSAVVMDDALVRGQGPHVLPDGREMRGVVHIDGFALVCDNAQVLGDALVTDAARVTDQAVVAGRAIVGGHASVAESARVLEDAEVGATDGQSGTPRVFGHATVKGQALVIGNASVYGIAIVDGQALVIGNASIFDHAEVGGRARVDDTAIVCGHARLQDDDVVLGATLLDGSTTHTGRVTCPATDRVVSIYPVRYTALCAWNPGWPPRVEWNG